MMVSPLCTAASVDSFLVEMRGLQLRSVGLQEHRAITGHARAHLEDHAGIDVLHRAIAAGAHAGVHRGGVDRHLVADIERGLGVVAHEHRRRLQQAHIGDLVQRAHHRRAVVAGECPAETIGAGSLRPMHRSASARAPHCRRTS
ncbi:hypothetical protein G6F58_012991 [Rhizopus delemar]|nr:hypothetical protein G6F58_012991 [Rhizopus delemar]